MPTPLNSADSIILGGLKSALKTALEAEYDFLKKDLLERLDNQKDQMIAGIMLHMMKQADIQTMVDRVIITVRTNPIVVKE